VDFTPEQAADPVASLIPDRCPLSAGNDIFPAKSRDLNFRHSIAIDQIKGSDEHPLANE
jgi:hypothetical protein